MGAKGVDAEGFLTREGSLGSVPPAFRPVVDTVRVHVPEIFGAERLHSAYLYGSIPRGTAIPGVSDLDVLLALHREPTEADRADARRLEADWDGALPQIDGAGMLLFGTAMLLSDLERYDLGWFVACLCTPLLGEDLAEHLPRYRPTSLLARESNGDLAQSLHRVRARAAAAHTDAERTALCRSLARKVVRTGLSLVMPRWGGWTSDLAESAEIFGAYYPAHADRMCAAAAAARYPTADPAVLESLLLDDLGPWLALTHTAVHGENRRAGLKCITMDWTVHCNDLRGSDVHSDPKSWLDAAALDPAVAELRPDYRALLVLAEGLRPGPSDSFSEQLLSTAEAEARERFADSPVEEHPHLAAWREAFRAFGAKPQRTRPSAEALLRRLSAGMPRVDRLTDIYNAVSVAHVVPVGGEDLAHYQGSARLVRAEGTEPFEVTTGGVPAVEHPRPGEVVWRDDAGVTCRRWNWRQCVRTRLTHETTRAVFILDALAPMTDAALAEAGDALTDALLTACPGATIASRAVTVPR